MNTLIKKLEFTQFLQALELMEGYDFSQYTKASLTRRIDDLLRVYLAPNIASLTTRLLHEKGFSTDVISSITVNVTDMFRDPEVFLHFRQEIIPVLKTYSRITLWLAGCATGEEAYSVAIVLKEEGIYERCNIYATDISLDALSKAEEGIYPLAPMKEYERNYKNSGGLHQLSDYYHTNYDFVVMDESLRKNIFFEKYLKWRFMAEKLYSFYLSLSATSL